VVTRDFLKRNAFQVGSNAVVRATIPRTTFTT